MAASRRNSIEDRDISGETNPTLWASMFAQTPLTIAHQVLPKPSRATTVMRSPGLYPPVSASIGAQGDRIPLTGKIISLADSFDAMTSKRTYRDAMSIKRAVSEIEKGLGTQFDEKIGKVFIESDVQQLWNIIQDGFIESWDYSNFSEYGTVAVGSLIK